MPQMMNTTCPLVTLMTHRPPMECQRASRSVPTPRSSGGSLAISATRMTTPYPASRPSTSPMSISTAPGAVLEQRVTPPQVADADEAERDDGEQHDGQDDPCLAGARRDRLGGPHGAGRPGRRAGPGGVKRPVARGGPGGIEGPVGAGGPRRRPWSWWGRRATAGPAPRAATAAGLARRPAAAAAGPSPGPARTSSTGGPPRGRPTPAAAVARLAPAGPGLALPCAGRTAAGPRAGRRAEGTGRPLAGHPKNVRG